MVQRMDVENRVALKDGRSVIIRSLLEQDQIALMNFGLGLPKNDLLYLEDDFQNPETINRLINANSSENWRQIVAVTDDESIVAYTAAFRVPGWSYHVANIRLIVDRAWRRSGLGMAMAQTIVEISRDFGATKVTVEMLAALTAGQAIFRHLGFAVEGQLARHAIDRDGNLHDIVMMSVFVRP